MGGRFQTTRWSVVLRAGEPTGEDSREALAELCEAYWYPVYGFVRGQGQREQDAADLTQAYFAALLDKGFLDGLHPEAGRFRSFLLVSLRNFLSHQRDHDRAQKRGGGNPTMALDLELAEDRLTAEKTGSDSPERSFELRWARTLIRRSLERLEQEFADAGQAPRFAALRGFLVDDVPTASYADIAIRLGVTENAVKTMVRRLRHRFGVVIRSEVAQTLGEREDVDTELRYLLQVLEGQ